MGKRYQNPYLHKATYFLEKCCKQQSCLVFCCNLKAVLFLATCYCNLPGVFTLSSCITGVYETELALCSYMAHSPFNDSPYHTWSSAGLALPSAPSPGPLVADPQRVHLQPVAPSLPEIDWSSIHEARHSHSFSLSLPIETVI